MLAAYIERLASLSTGAVQAKEFNDNVWGTISLQPAEVIVLDSPLLQRLRRIRQLGVAQWVYPGANHSRLEHSLGVSTQVQRLTESVNSHADGQDFGELTDSWVQVLRMSGLCHDVGHGLMSHVIENALVRDPQCVDLILEFQDHVQEKETESQLSEIAAYFLLRSPAFGRLIAQARRIARLPPDETFHERVANCVIGVSHDDQLPLIHEVITGPFDCDKLDYMTRDALMCGVPVVTDVTRLVQKVRAAQVGTDRLPDEIAASVRDRDEQHLIIAIARSGASTLHEVSLARSLMHDKIYRHHKVRATEAMVAGVVSEVGEYIEPYSPMLPFALTDDEFLALDASQIAAYSNARDADSGAVDVAADLIRRMRERDLFVRAFAFAQKMPLDPYRDDIEQRRAIEELIRDAGKTEERSELVQKIVAETGKILSALGAEDLLEQFPGRNIRPYIWIDPPKTDVTDAETDQSRAYLIEDDHRLVTMGQVSAETRGWADAYINVRDLGYVFCPRELAPYIHIATEVVLRTSRKIVVPRPMHSYAKVEPATAAALRRRLADRGYFEGLPRELGPTPDFLALAGTRRAIEAEAKRLAGYSGPNIEADSGKASNGSLNDGKIHDFLSQFPPRQIPAALKVLQNTLIIDRRAINNAVSRFLSSPEGTEFKSAAIVPPGEPKDGASVLAYYAGDTAATTECEVMSLNDALAQDRPVLFVDDVIGRGSSLISIFENYLDEEDTQHLNEIRGEPLAHHARAALRERRLAIVTGAGRRVGIDNIKRRSAELGLDVTVFSAKEDEELPTVDTALQEFGERERAEFVEFCRTTGASLVDNQSKRDERALGYGNHAFLVTSSINTPTMTLTVLWGGSDLWRPIFPRRPKR